jgi:hypothetical protein
VAAVLARCSTLVDVGEEGALHRSIRAAGPRLANDGFPTGLASRVGWWWRRPWPPQSANIGRRSNKPCATTISTHSVFPDSTSPPKLNPVEPPWYGPVCPVVGEGWHREVSPYPDLGWISGLSGLMSQRRGNAESGHMRDWFAGSKWTGGDIPQ